MWKLMLQRYKLRGDIGVFEIVQREHFFMASLSLFKVFLWKTKQIQAPGFDNLTYFIQKHWLVKNKPSFCSGSCNQCHAATKLQNKNVAQRRIARSVCKLAVGSSLFLRSSDKDPRPPKVVFHQWSSSTEGRLPPKVVFHCKSSSTKGCLPPKDLF